MVVSQDDLIDAITPSGFDYSARAVYAAAEEAIARAALKEGRVVVIDRTNRTRDLRRRWAKIAEEACCPAIAIVLSCDWSLCRMRNLRRTGHRRVPEHRMERMIEVFERPSVGEGFAAVFDACDAHDVSAVRRLIASTAAAVKLCSG